MEPNATNGTCVIGRLPNLSAFASVEQDGKVWVKSYPTVEAALQEARGSGLVDMLFAAAAALYIQGRHKHCVSPVAVPLDDRKLAALGFLQPRSALHS